MPATGSAGVAGTAAAVRRWRSTPNPGTARTSAAGWAGLCDAGVAAGSGCGDGFVGDGGGVAAAVAAADVAVAAAGGAAASVGAAAGVGAGSSVMR